MNCARLWWLNWNFVYRRWNPARISRPLAAWQCNQGDCAAHCLTPMRGEELARSATKAQKQKKQE